MSILEQLYALQDTGYADFQSGLVPNIPRERFIGVRMPNMRRLAKQMAKEDAAQAFIVEEHILCHKGAYTGKSGITRDRTGKSWYYRNLKR